MAGLSDLRHQLAGDRRGGQRARRRRERAVCSRVWGVMVYVIQEQRRYQEAEQVQREVIDIYQGLGYGVDSGQVVNAQVFLAQILNLERRYDEASKLYDQVDVWTAKWEPSRRAGT